MSLIVVKLRFHLLDRRLRSWSVRVSSQAFVCARCLFAPYRATRNRLSERTSATADRSHARCQKTSICVGSAPVWTRYCRSGSYLEVKVSASCVTLF